MSRSTKLIAVPPLSSSVYCRERPQFVEVHIIHPVEEVICHQLILAGDKCGVFQSSSSDSIANEGYQLLLFVAFAPIVVSSFDEPIYTFSTPDKGS